MVPVPSIQLSQGRFIADFNAISSRHLEYSLFFPSTPTFDPYVCLSVCFWICIAARRTLSDFPLLMRSRRTVANEFQQKGDPQTENKGWKTSPRILSVELATSDWHFNTLWLCRLSVGCENFQEMEMWSFLLRCCHDGVWEELNLSSPLRAALHP